MFTSPEKMQKYLESHDLYCEAEETYVFRYSEKGSIAYYKVSPSFAKILQSKSESTEQPGYWGQFLGPGGYIFDGTDADNFCNENYKADWIDTNCLTE